jgi:hypothetical protein
MKTISAALFAVVALTSVAGAAPFDPANSSYDNRIAAQLRAAPKGEVSSFVTAYDPARDASDDRAVAARSVDETGAVATHDAPVSGYVPTIDRAVSERD